MRRVLATARSSGSHEHLPLLNIAGLRAYPSIASVTCTLGSLKLMRFQEKSYSSLLASIPLTTVKGILAPQRDGVVPSLALGSGGPGAFHCDPIPILLPPAQREQAMAHPCSLMRKIASAVRLEKKVPNLNSAVNSMSSLC
jgi:hypothetical protein